MKKISNTVLILLLFLMTVAYSWFIGLAIGMFRVLISNGGYTAMPNITVVFSMNALPWQVLAFVSLIINIAIALIIMKKEKDGHALSKRALYHTLWIMTCFFMHGVGFLIPFVVRAYIIK